MLSVTGTTVVKAARCAVLKEVGAAYSVLELLAQLVPVPHADFVGVLVDSYIVGSVDTS